MSGESVDTIGARMIGSHDGPVKTYSPGRICGQAGCGVRLSVYNPSDRCGLHAGFQSIPCVGAPTLATALARPLSRHSRRTRAPRSSQVAA